MSPLEAKMQQCMGQILDRAMNSMIPARQQNRGRAFHEEMDQYFADVKSGKVDIPEGMVEAICIASMQAIIKFFDNHQEMKHRLVECANTGERMTEEHEHHKKFKEVVDKLRAAKGSNEIQELINEHFENLTQEENNCLHQLAKAFSRKGNADALRVSVEMWENIKKNTEKKLKV